MRLRALISVFLVASCAAADFHAIGEQDQLYAARYPYFAEFCAVSQIKKKPGFGADIRGEIGGHAVLFLEGACRDRDAHYPMLRLCGRPGDEDGVGLSMNAHFRNAKWVATPGRAFFFDGDLPPGQGLSQAQYQTVQRRAETLGLYDGVEFHDEVFDAMPRTWQREAWKYEVSVATDYAISLGRGRYCARIPVNQVEMRRMIAFLNAENAPYRAGAVFRWNVFQDNCIHLAHNALAAAGLWSEWPTHRFLLWAMLDFPVPKNEFVNMMRAANTLPGAPDAVYRDPVARRELLEDDALTARPGVLAQARPPWEPNDVYETKLKLIFYDDPILGSYHGWFDAIFREARYTDPWANRAYFADQARQIAARRKPVESYLLRAPFRDDPATFTRVYEAFYRAIGRYAAAW